MASNIAEERKKLKAREAKNAEDAKKPVHKVRNFFFLFCNKKTDND